MKSLCSCLGKPSQRQQKLVPKKRSSSAENGPSSSKWVNSSNDHPGSGADEDYLVKVLKRPSDDKQLEPGGMLNTRSTQHRSISPLLSADREAAMPLLSKDEVRLDETSLASSNGHTSDRGKNKAMLIKDMKGQEGEESMPLIGGGEAAEEGEASEADNGSLMIHVCEEEEVVVEQKPGSLGIYNTPGVPREQTNTDEANLEPGPASSTTSEGDLPVRSQVLDQDICLANKADRDGDAPGNTDGPYGPDKANSDHWGEEGANRHTTDNGRSVYALTDADTVSTLSSDSKARNIQAGDNQNPASLATKSEADMQHSSTSPSSAPPLVSDFTTQNESKSSFADPKKGSKGQEAMDSLPKVEHTEKDENLLVVGDTGSQYDSHNTEKGLPDVIQVSDLQPDVVHQKSTMQTMSIDQTTGSEEPIIQTFCVTHVQNLSTMNCQRRQPSPTPGAKVDHVNKLQEEDSAQPGHTKSEIAAQISLHKSTTHKLSKSESSSGSCSSDQHIEPALDSGVGPSDVDISVFDIKESDTSKTTVAESDEPCSSHPSQQQNHQGSDANEADESDNSEEGDTEDRKFDGTSSIAKSSVQAGVSKKSSGRRRRTPSKIYASERLLSINEDEDDDVAADMTLRGNLNTKSPKVKSGTPILKQPKRSNLWARRRKGKRLTNS